MLHARHRRHVCRQQYALPLMIYIRYLRHQSWPAVEMIMYTGVARMSVKCESFSACVRQRGQRLRARPGPRRSELTQCCHICTTATGRVKKYEASRRLSTRMFLPRCHRV
jgi:hypothetical protein